VVWVVWITTQSTLDRAAVSNEKIWQVLLPDGSAWVPADSRPDDPRRSWIYSRSIADMFARDVGGEVVEVSRHQREKLLDQEIATVLTEPKTRPVKTRARPFPRTAREALATAILESVPLTYAARSALDTTRETADEGEHRAALGALKKGLPATLWIGYDPKSTRGFAQEAEPVWNTDDPQGEAPGQWRQIVRDEIVDLLIGAPAKRG
jgi:hypothetical protein